MTSFLKPENLKRKLTVCSGYDSDIQKFCKPVLKVVPLLITVTFRKFPGLWLILEPKVAKIPTEIRFF